MGKTKIIIHKDQIWLWMFVCAQLLSRVRLSVAPWTVAHQVPLFMGSSRQEYWSGWPFPSPGNLPDSGTEPRSPILQAYSLPSKPPGKPMWTKDHVTLCKEKVTRSVKANFQSSFNPKNTHGVPEVVICAKYVNLRTKLNEGNFIN